MEFRVKEYVFEFIVLFDKLESFTVVEFIVQTAERGRVKFVFKQFEGKFKVKSIGKVMVM